MRVTKQGTNENSTCSFSQSKPGEVCNAVKAAIVAGYRHIDCAWVYENEDEVGQAIADKIADGTITREDIFVTTKVGAFYCFVCLFTLCIDLLLYTLCPSTCRLKALTA